MEFLFEPVGELVLELVGSLLQSVLMAVWDAICGLIEIIATLFAKW